MVIEAVAMELRDHLEHPLPVVARRDLGDRTLQLVVSGSKLVAPALGLGAHGVPPALGGFACRTRAGYATGSRGVISKGRDEGAPLTTEAPTLSAMSRPSE